MDDIVNFAKKLGLNVSSSIRVCMPAKIESYDYTTQKADVKIDMKELYKTGEVDYPVVSGVPVVFMSAGGASITMPVKKGDSCLVMFCDRDLSNWLEGGLGQKPDSNRMHDLTDAIAIMGLMDFKKKSAAENNTDVLINYSGSKVRIKPDGVLEIETTKTINIKATETINVESKNINIKTIEDVNITSKNITATASDNTTVNSKDVIFNVTENTTVNSKAVVLTASANITAKCVDANIEATNNINSKALKFIHTGDMSVSGNFELGGVGSGANGGVITFSGGIKSTGDFNNTGSIINAGGTIRSGKVILDTHTHSYSAPVVGSTPTAAVPAVTGTPT